MPDTENKSPYDFSAVTALLDDRNRMARELVEANNKVTAGLRKVITSIETAIKNLDEESVNLLG